MRFGKRLAKFVLWFLILSAAITACAGWFAYAYVTDGEEAARLIRTYAARYLPNSTLDIGRVKLRPLAGELTISQVYVRQRIDGAEFLSSRIPYLSIRFDPRQLVDASLARVWPWLHDRVRLGQSTGGAVDVHEVQVVQPLMRLRQRRDGTWNLQGLLASPWPGPNIDNPPPIVIRSGTVELVLDDRDDHAPLASQVASGRPAKPAVENSSDRSVERARFSTEGVRKSRLLNVSNPAGAVTPPTAPGTLPGVGDGQAVLRDVSLVVEAAPNKQFRFEGSAHGDLFDRISLKGTLDPENGDVSLEGELSALTLSEALLRRLPPEAQSPFRALALVGGEVDLELARLNYRPDASADRRLDYDLTARLRGGVWECPKLPFPIYDLSALITARDGRLNVRHVHGRNGSTTLRAEGVFTIGHPDVAPFDLRIDLLELELDRRLKDKTPPQYLELWDVFQPKGRVNTLIHVARPLEGGPVGLGATIQCRGLSGLYRHFKYPLESLTGSLVLEGNTLKVDLENLIGGQPARLKGTIWNPGPDAVVKLGIQAASIPVDETFKKALPPDVRKVVDRFNPSGSVKADIRVDRKPMVGPGAKPEGHLAIDADLDLNPRCEITWNDLPFPVRNLTGRLILRPDLWIFQNMRGNNGQAIISGNGRVEKPPGLPKLPNGEPPLKIDLKLHAENLPFHDDLRRALPVAWRKSWTTVNPTGSSDVDADIRIEPGRPDFNHITIAPRAESGIRLAISPQTGNGPGPQGIVEIRMENVLGRFDFINGKVAMQDCTFLFHGAPVQFQSGEVTVKDSGQFELSASDLWVREIRFDPGLRKLMPPLMAAFARRLDDGRPFTARGNLQIGWSGVATEPAWCKWDNTRVVFINNTVKTEIPLEHIQGQLDEVSGWCDGRTLEVKGNTQIESVTISGLQVTQLFAPFYVAGGEARLDSLRAKLLGGELIGKGRISLADTPRYGCWLKLSRADLQEYALYLPGRQSFRGTLGAEISLSGLGTDIHSVQGEGNAHIRQGVLGELPVALRLVKFLNSNQPRIGPSRISAKTMFDAVDLDFRIVDGTTILNPIKLTGSVFSLQGQGFRDPLGNLDLTFSPLAGRDNYPVPIISDAMREVSSWLYVIHVTGPASYPRFAIKPLPQIPKPGSRRIRK